MSGVRTYSIRAIAEISGSSPAAVGRQLRKLRDEECATGAAMVEGVTGKDGKIYPADRESRITRANAIIEYLSEHPDDSTHAVAKIFRCSPATVLRYWYMLYCSGVPNETTEQLDEAQP